jgi:hypothetical protein
MLIWLAAMSSMSYFTAIMHHSSCRAHISCNGRLSMTHLLPISFISFISLQRHCRQFSYFSDHFISSSHALFRRLLSFLFHYYSHYLANKIYFSFLYCGFA